MCLKGKGYLVSKLMSVKFLSKTEIKYACFKSLSLIGCSLVAIQKQGIVGGSDVGV